MSFLEAFASQLGPWELLEAAPSSQDCRMSVEITFALRTQIRGQKMPISGLSIPVRKDWHGYYYCWLISGRKVSRKL
jgi:hypothetical protein